MPKAKKQDKELEKDEKKKGDDEEGDDKEETGEEGDFDPDLLDDLMDGDSFDDSDEY